MVQRFPIIPVKSANRGIPLKVFLFSEKFSVEKLVPFKMTYVGREVTSSRYLWKI